MKHIAVIALICYISFILEFILFNFWGGWGKPELLILTVVFFNLYLGIRFSIIAAVMGGLLKDSCGIAPFGTFMLVYIAAAYVTTFARRYLYQPGSKFSRAVVVFFSVIGCFLVQSILSAMNHELPVHDLLLYILIPQLVTTMLAATFVFAQLKNISIFFSLKN